MPGNLSTPGASVTSRVFALLGAFDAEHRSMPVSVLARRAGVPLATAHRLVTELVALGGLERRGDEYVIGRRLWDLGLLAPVQAELRHVAAPFLQDLFAAAHATVHLAERAGHEVLYLDRLSGRADVPVLSRVGGRLPLHATGVGKVLLAHAPADVRRAVLADLPRLTPYTLTRPALLAEQLERVRRDGFARTVDEMSVGACSVAVPVRRRGEVVAALGLVLPDLRRGHASPVAALTVAAAGIGRSLSAQ
ncbi:IclR family transcriptional regulator [Pseudonocardia sp. HH130630-07]|uniref:IclR family transcriptional regulator n=1 Tax=Pseudonocardia sp. HH130630-07 TaxID=1690815 RepID=UPI0008152798|nr:IclR family transcriptional regulator [Pseudonocardia sp. HH130630-07]ANY08905.1 IclR family transcriptional regulator [Pseudonocardia sp. HH130630-07]